MGPRDETRSEHPLDHVDGHAEDGAGSADDGHPGYRDYAAGRDVGNAGREAT